MSQRLLQPVTRSCILLRARMNSSVAPAREDREQALRSVLESQTFARSEQLKNFLRYVCELEIGGRGGEIKEYSIGVEALGRPSSYSTTADSSVRRRAFELRHKLEEAYNGELASSEVRIELPKGSYVPVFRFYGATPVDDPAPAIEGAPPSRLAGLCARSRWRRLVSYWERSRCASSDQPARWRALARPSSRRHGDLWRVRRGTC